MADEAKEPLTNEPTSEAAPYDAGEHPHLSDTTVVFGREVTVRGGIYTVVFGFLAVATLIEVILGGLNGVVFIPILLGIAVVKAGMVVSYYMHLRTDIRLFTYILLVPMGIALVAALYLISVPPTGY